VTIIRLYFQPFLEVDAVETDLTFTQTDPLLSDPDNSTRKCNFLTGPELSLTIVGPLVVDRSDNLDVCSNAVHGVINSYFAVSVKVQFERNRSKWIFVTAYQQTLGQSVKSKMLHLTSRIR
jgi:hypothetical protein